MLPLRVVLFGWNLEYRHNARVSHKVRSNCLDKVSELMLELCIHVPALIKLLFLPFLCVTNNRPYMLLWNGSFFTLI